MEAEEEQDSIFVTKGVLRVKFLLERPRRGSERESSTIASYLVRADCQGRQRANGVSQSTSQGTANLWLLTQTYTKSCST